LSNIFTITPVCLPKSPAGWDEVSYVSTKWNGKNILNIGKGEEANGAGIKINIPKGGYNIIWVRVLNDRWANFRACPYISDTNFNFPKGSCEEYATGFRTLNQISPDGSGPDASWQYHAWMPIPVRGQNTTEYMLHCAIHGDCWISGIAFGKNIWNHAYNSAIAYTWGLNGGQAVQSFTKEQINSIWNSDILSYFAQGTSLEISVPVVYSGKDKMIYIVEHNNNWVGIMHTAVYVNGKMVDRLRTTWRNPFALHHNGKFYSRYIATRIPASMILPTDHFLAVRIDMSEVTDANIFFQRSRDS